MGLGALNVVSSQEKNIFLASGLHKRGSTLQPSSRSRVFSLNKTKKQGLFRGG